MVDRTGLENQSPRKRTAGSNPAPSASTMRRRTPSRNAQPPEARIEPHAPVAQLDRASVYGTEGREFESLRARYKRPANARFSCLIGVGAPRRRCPGYVPGEA